jgi:hypothetical protein
MGFILQFLHAMDEQGVIRTLGYKVSANPARQYQLLHLLVPLLALPWQ